MRTTQPPPWTLDPKEPKAPPQAIWDGLSARERQRLADALLIAPNDELDAMAPEGTRHDDEVSNAADRLRQWFGAGRRQAFVARNMRVFYPDEVPFDPDVLVVLDVPRVDRDAWFVPAEGGRGLDVVIEVLWKGSRTKDLATNVERFARLGIPEYYVVDLPRARLHAHHLAPGESRYRIVEANAGRITSPLLDLDLMFDGRTLRFNHGMTPVLSPSEAYGQLQAAMAGLSNVIAAAEARAEAETARAEELKARAEVETARVEALEQRLADLLAERKS